MKKYKKTYIEITNVCNLSCQFCPKTTRKPQFMSREVFERILSQMNGRTKFIYFHVMGEPFLHPELDLFLDICKDYGFKVNITTNGTLIDEVMDSIISKPALRQVNFSLHSFEANDCQYTLDNYLDKIFTFINKVRNTNIQICLRLWNLSEHGLKDENNYILMRMKNEFGLNNIIEETLTPCNGINLTKNVFLNQSAKFDWPVHMVSNKTKYNDQQVFINREDRQEVKGFCYGLRDQVAFLVDGTVVPCCLDGEGIINLGNIIYEEFESILESTRAKAFYNGLSGYNVVEELCKKCTFRHRFDDRVVRSLSSNV